MKRIQEVSMKNVNLPNEDLTRKTLYDNAEKAIEGAKLFCAVVEALNDGLVDRRLENRSGLIEVLEEYARYTSMMKSDKFIWYNRANHKDGSLKIWFEC